jgi:acyl-CoA synthetase (AMP-forming)/AMP-acid ligase II
MKHSVRRRIQAVAEALLPGLPGENLGLLARNVSRLAEAVLARAGAGAALIPAEQDELSQAVEASAARFLSHLSRRSTAELWESFAVPWDYADLLARVRSGQYAAALMDDVLWAVGQTVAMFRTAPPRSTAAARKAARVQASARESVRLSGKTP